MLHQSDLAHASLALILFGLAITGLGLPIPEMVFILAAGVVSQRTGLSIVFPVAGCSLAVLVGDLALFYLARLLGPPAFRHRPLRWILPHRIRPRIDSLFARHGSMAIFVARHLTGVRAATYALAGMHGVPVGKFVLWDSLAISVSVPIYAVFGYMFSTRLDELEGQIRKAHYVVAGAVVVVAVGYAARTWLHRARNSGQPPDQDERSTPRPPPPRKD
ncbi:DedA family protein [Myxococcota bacterium]